MKKRLILIDAKMWHDKGVMWARSNNIYWSYKTGWTVLIAFGTFALGLAAGIFIGKGM